MKKSNFLVTGALDTYELPVYWPMISKCQHAGNILSQNVLPTFHGLSLCHVHRAIPTLKSLEFQCCYKQIQTLCPLRIECILAFTCNYTNACSPILCAVLPAWQGRLTMFYLCPLCVVSWFPQLKSCEVSFTFKHAGHYAKSILLLSPLRNFSFAFVVQFYHWLV